MFGQYGPSETFKNVWALLLTKIIFPGARLVRRPFYLRGGRKRFVYGDGFTCGYSCRFDLAGNGTPLVFGKNCKINDRVHISAHESVVIGDNVLMASNIFISDNSHGSYGANPSLPDMAPDDREVVTKPVRIGNNVWIGEGAAVMPGVTVGNGVIIGTNAVVTHDVPDNTIVAGIPAKPIKSFVGGGGFPVENGETPKVSIIVPMYNVGEYAVACLRSLMGQTYNNVEIVVVDDGSTDETADICARTIAGDGRAKLVRKENGGLSSARNFGLAHATGDFVTFVDGDDVLDEWAVGHLVALAQKTGAPLVTCEYKKIDSTEDFGGQEVCEGKVVTGDELLGMMLLLNGESGSACGKLYAKELFPLLVFPEGQLFEDFGVEATIFSSVEKACISGAELYGYLAREGSITTNKKYGDKHLEGMEASLSVVRRIVDGKPELKDALACFEAFCSLRVASRLDLAKCANKVRAKAYISEARKRCRNVASSPLASKTWRLRCRLFAVSPALHNLVYSLYGKLFGKVVG